MARAIGSNTRTASGNALLIRENEARSERLRAKLDRMGGELRPLRRGRADRLESDDVWGIRWLTRSLRIEVRTDRNEGIEAIAQDVARTLASCGFNAKVSSESGIAWEGVHIESQPNQAAAALMIQGAFRVAGLGAGLTIHDRAAANRIVVHIGAHALG
jgi:hypothetical protein